MVLPQTPSSRLTALKNARVRHQQQQQQQQQQRQQQTGITDYLRRTSSSSGSIIPHIQNRRTSTSSHNASSSISSTTTAQQTTRQKSPVLSETPQNTSSSTSSSSNSSKILDGVVACLDVRTEDGDDVSQNFERALQSMGAKTRRVFSDSITHLIFKNGSPATLKKALSKNVFIINLLWVSRCKREGKRLAEKDFVIERPQGLALAGKKRRKSMEPGKVRALEPLHPSLSSGSDGSINEGGAEQKNQDTNRRNTIATSNWKARDFNQSKGRSEARSLKRDRLLLEQEELDEDPASALPKEIKLNPSRLSLPISVESIANRHNKKQRTDIIPIHAPSLEKKEQIKARFSIGSKSSSTSVTNSTAAGEEDHVNGTTSLSKLNINGSSSISSSSLSPRLPSSANTSSTTPIKRKRRLTGLLSRPTTMSLSSSLENIANALEIIPESSTSIEIAPAQNKATIVLTSVTNHVRKQCEEAIKKLGKYELASEVTDNTTHVLVGAQRRTKSVTLGLLRGVWMLKPEWLIQSASKNHYVSEKEYELLDWYPRADIARKHDPLFPSTTHIKVLSSTYGVGFIEDLVKLAGGTLVKNMGEADIIIADAASFSEVEAKDKIVVSDVWLFECIEQYRYLSTDNYTLN